MPDLKAVIRAEVSKIVSQDMANAPRPLSVGSSGIPEHVLAYARQLASDGVEKKEVAAATHLLKQSRREATEALAQVRTIRFSGDTTSEAYTARLDESYRTIFESYALETLQRELVRLRDR